MEIDYKSRKTFCIAPWSTLQVLPNGDVNLCCLSPSDKVIGNITETSISEVWNGEKMKEIRKNFLNDVPQPEYCGRCYQKEADGFTSLRNGLNANYAERLKQEVENTNEDGSTDKVTLKHWDFRFSNICNFACRTCGPGFSTKWVNDFRRLYGESDILGASTLISIAQDRDDPLLDELAKMINEMESIHLAGGEPLMMEAHYHLLDTLIREKAEGKNIQYSTNLSTLDFKKKSIFDYWEELCKNNTLRLSISIDGVDDVFNYSRFPGVFSEVIENVQELKARNIKNLQYYFHPTVSIFTVFDLPRLHRYLLDNNLFYWFDTKFQDHLLLDQQYDHYALDFMINVLIYPNHYAISNLPDNLKTEVKALYDEHIEYLNSRKIDSSGFVKVLENMFSSPANIDEQKRFWELTRKLDNIRGQDIYAAVPQMARFEIPE